MDANAAAAGLAARDAELVAADERLLALLHAAYEQALDAIRRIDAVRAQVESATVGRAVQSAVEGAGVGRFLLEKNREILGIIEEATTAAAAKTVALRELAQYYRTPTQR